jgi:hypothetical protein
VIMVVNSTIMQPALSPLHKVFIFAFPALTRPNKMAKPNVLLDPSITLYVLCYFKHRCHLHIGSNLFAPL